MQCLVYLGLRLLGNCNSHDALELLAKTQADLLRVFHDCQEDPFKALPGPDASADTLPGVELHKINLIRSLHSFVGGMVDCRPPHGFDPRFSPSDNSKFYGSLVGVHYANPFGTVDAKQMDNAALKSKVFTSAHMRSRDLMEWRGWSISLMASLPIGFPERDLVCCTKGRA